MPDVGSDQSWATSQLVEFLGVLSGQSDEASATRAGVERVLESLDAEIGMLVTDRAATVVVGLQPDDTRLAGLIDATLAGEPATTLDELGECRIATVGLELTGKVKTAKQKDRAEKAAKKVKGVKKVVNNIAISPV